MDNVSYVTYLYYFQDRKTDKTYQEMKIYSSIFWKTTRVIIQKLNKGVRQPALASSSQPK
ncbi:hypothetical protein [Xanthocytophaga agilis]|uniref:Uncharacterized protein n=1 Tax=Xanthocytophaga agilis TaxID=3048010 RepID=A0AAE3RBD5_9BACT|nr:hypothetical protein [Xanthocytophaga agilis]MDJ1504322.1 hypothetical protein [Xanthocytophaga agilis]